jgi:O-antigen/teichoic acid export membrane protein
MRVPRLSSLGRCLGEGLCRSGFLRGTAALVGGNAVTAVLVALQVAIVAACLGAEGYGTAALALGYASLVHGLLDLRSSEVSLRYLGTFASRGEAAPAQAISKLGLLVDLAVSLLAAGTVAATAPWAARAFVKNPEAAVLVVAAGAGLLPRAVVGTSYAVLASADRFGTVARLNVLGTAARTGAILGLVLAGAGPAGVVLGSAFGGAVSAAAFFLAARSAARVLWGGGLLSGRLSSLRGHYREIFGFLLAHDASGLIGAAARHLDVLAVGWFGGPAEAGLYKVARRAASAVGYLAGPLQAVSYPRLVQRVASRDERALGQFLRRLVLGVGLPLAVATVATSWIAVPVVLPRLLGAEFSSAVGPAVLLIAAAAVGLGGFWIRPLLYAEGRPRAWLAANAIATGGGLAGCFLVLPQAGLAGLAATVLVAQLAGYGFGAVRALGIRRAGQERVSLVDLAAREASSPL